MTPGGPCETGPARGVDPCNPLKTLKTNENIFGEIWKSLQIPCNYLLWDSIKSKAWLNPSRNFGSIPSYFLAFLALPTTGATSQMRSIRRHPTPALDCFPLIGGRNDGRRWVQMIHLFCHVAFAPFGLERRRTTSTSSGLSDGRKRLASRNRSHSPLLPLSCPRSCAASSTGSGASASAAPSLRSGGCARGSQKTAGRLPPAYDPCSCRCRSACAARAPRGA